jgi:hypothetical protein
MLRLSPTPLGTFPVTPPPPPIRNPGLPAPPHNPPRRPPFPSCLLPISPLSIQTPCHQKRGAARTICRADPRSGYEVVISPRSRGTEWGHRHATRKRGLQGRPAVSRSGFRSRRICVFHCSEGPPRIAGVMSPAIPGTASCHPKPSADRPAWAAGVSVSDPRPATPSAHALALHFPAPAHPTRTRSRPRPRDPLAAIRGPALQAARNYPTDSS